MRHHFLSWQQPRNLLVEAGSEGDRLSGLADEHGRTKRGISLLLVQKQKLSQPKEMFSVNKEVTRVSQ